MTFAEILGPSSALFLDFDGTLVDIAPQPEAVRVPRPLVESLAAMQERLDGAIAIVSGRPIAQIDEFLAPLRLPAAGVHGAERRRADGSMQLFNGPSLDRVEAAARALAARHPELRVEPKRGSLALHYRQAPQLEAQCLLAMQAAVDASPGLVLLRGKMVAEAKPAGASKGHAVEEFLAEAPFAGRTPVFIGDDVTDEAGFAAVQRLGGLGVKVGEGETAALRRLPDPAAFRKELQAMVAARSRGVVP